MSCVLWHWRVIQNSTYGLENDMKNFTNVYQSTRKSQNWDFDGALLSKVENVWA